jgi:spermidine synthase
MRRIIPPQQIGNCKVEHLNGINLYVNDVVVDNGDISYPCYYLSNLVPGDILVGGLGLGYLATHLSRREDITSITVIEKYADVIDMVKPYIDNNKLTVVGADIFTWEPTGEWDSIIINIFPCTSQEITDLTTKFSPYLKPGGWIGSWEDVYNG